MWSLAMALLRSYGQWLFFYNKVLQGCKFLENVPFLKAYSIEIKNSVMEMVMWHTCAHIGVAYHIFELLPSDSLYHPVPSKLFPEICPL